MSSLAKQDTTLRLSISIGDTGSVELMTFNTSVSSDHTFNEIQQLVQEHSLYYKIDENNDELIGGDLSNSKELYLVSGTHKNKLTVDMISELKDGDLIVIGGALPTSTKSTESKVNNGGVQATNTVATGEEIKRRPTTNADYLEEARTLYEMGILTENEYNELRMVYVNSMQQDFTQETTITKKSTKFQDAQLLDIQLRQLSLQATDKSDQ